MTGRPSAERESVEPRSIRTMATGRLVALLAASTVAVGACGAESSITAERSVQLGFEPTVIDPGTPDPTVAPTDPDTDTDPGNATSAPPTPTTAPAPTPSVPIDTGAIDFGPDKPGRAYDEFLLAVVTDLELWWTEQFPSLYGSEFTPLEGSIYAAYPGRPDDIPGCGTASTTYREVQEYVAFYCGVGDFLVYDDGDDGLLAELARDYGAGTIGTVLAHEYAHAIQLRAGNLDLALPTILTEQQADCFAGAWTGRAARGEAATLRYSDGDVRAGLIAMTKVSDPLGIDQFVPGGHGSGFDRVGAFQVGYTQGLGRCAGILDDPLPLVPNEFVDEDDLRSGGNAPFGYGDDELLGFLPDDLNLYWDEELASALPTLGPLRLAVIQSVDSAACDDLRGPLDRGAGLCASTGVVLVNEPAARELYLRLGDFSVGYLLGLAWGEAVQESLGSALTGEARALLNDCLTGGWVQTVIPGPAGLPQPRLAERTAVVSAGDLDEAIQTVLDIADLAADDDAVGTAFEKIAALRAGVIDGTDACLDQL